MILRLTVLCYLICAVACTSGSDEQTNPTYIFVGPANPALPYLFGDVVQSEGEGLRLRNSITGRDTLLLDPGAAVRPSGPAFVSLAPLKASSSINHLTRQPYTYHVGDATYWASFEPAFTGFPEYTRPGTKDFVNRLVDWSGTAPGLEYSEYRIDTSAGRPILYLSERDRGRYVQTVAVVVDSVLQEGFRGQLYRPGSRVPQSVLFTPAPSGTTRLEPSAFIERVNAGYSRSYLLLPPPSQPSADTTKRLPRRALIDAGDPGTISASFLENGTFMLLSDDHIVLQGSFVLDLDKGLLTVEELGGQVYRIFLDADPTITFTVPVSVLTLRGTVMQGYDNYLRIEVVQLPDA